ncbi:MAG TPA: hypothetical protein VK943_17470, partial [Arenibaculum sp.]|nr:hypothetical protein [Arenibaculum sp.]
MFSRRRFIEVLLAAGAVPALSGAGRASEAGIPADPAAQGSAADRAIFAAVVPAVLAGALPADGHDRERAIAETVDGMHT